MRVVRVPLSPGQPSRGGVNCEHQVYRYWPLQSNIGINNSIIIFKSYTDNIHFIEN